MLTTDSTRTIPFYKSYLLNQIVYLNRLSELSMQDLELLNVDTRAALDEARYNYATFEDKQSDDANAAYRRLKIAGYFQAAIKLKLADF